MSKHLSTGALVVFVLLWGMDVLAVESYPKGHGPLEVFDADGFAATPLWVQLWVGFLMSTFAAGLFFVRNHALARWASGGFIVSAATGHLTFSILGLPFLGGSIAIMHIVCWTPALVLLLLKRPFLDANEGPPYRIWSAIMTGAILFSFVFDFRDASTYIGHIINLG